MAFDTRSASFISPFSSMVSSSLDKKRNTSFRSTFLIVYMLCLVARTTRITILFLFFRKNTNLNIGTYCKLLSFIFCNIPISYHFCQRIIKYVYLDLHTWLKITWTIVIPEILGHPWMFPIFSFFLCKFKFKSVPRKKKRNERNDKLDNRNIIMFEILGHGPDERAILIFLLKCIGQISVNYRQKVFAEIFPKFGNSKPVKKKDVDLPTVTLEMYCSQTPLL